MLIIPANFRSPEALDNAKELVASLETAGNYPCISDVSGASVAGAIVEAAYGEVADDLSQTFQKALDALSGDRAFVRLFTRVHFSKCVKKRCMLIRKRYEWETSPSTPTPWTEYTGLFHRIIRLILCPSIRSKPRCRCQWFRFQQRDCVARGRQLIWPDEFDDF